MPDITYDVGRVSFVMKGAWNLATAYEKLDAVSYNGSLYIAKQDVPGGTAITNTTYWQLAAEKGDQGETGNGIASITLTGTAGNVDTYTITFTDGTTTTFTVTNGGVTTVNGRTGDVTGLAEEDGSYPLLNAGTADNLTPYSEDSGAMQDIPFIAQGTGCGNGESVVDTGSYLQFKKKLGNTVGVNQLVNPTKLISSSGTGWTMTANGDGTMTLVVTTAITTQTNVNLTANTSTSYLSVPAGHKFIFHSPTTRPGNSIFRDGYAGAGLGWNVINEKTGSSPILLQLALRDVPTGTYKIVPLFHDLAIWFGSNDRIPSDLLSHPENWGRYYSGSLDYAAGYLDSADGSILTSIHRNIWDEEWEVGVYNNNTGEKAYASGYIRSKNKISVIPNTQYYTNVKLWLMFYDASGAYISYLAKSAPGYFTVPANCHQLAFNVYDDYGGTYKNDITISLYYSGESGYNQYYPFQILAEIDTGSEALRSAGTAADEKLPGGQITRKVGYVDLGSIGWYSAANASGRTFSTALNSVIRKGSGGHHGDFIQSNLFVGVNKPSMSALEDGEMSIDIGGNLQICKSSFANYSVAQIRTALSGVYLYYELATPTTEQGTAFAENIPCDDFGSLMWTQTKGIPQGVEIFYPVDYKASIDTLYKKVNGDMSKIVTEDEYPEAPSSDGTYVLKATVSGGTKTYAWVAE